MTSKRTLSFAEISSRLTHDDVLAAAKRIAEDGVPSSRQRMYYDVYVDGVALPPKLVLQRAVGAMASRYDEVPSDWGEGGRGFGGGSETNRVLERLGFVVRDIRESEPDTSAVARVGETLDREGEFTDTEDREWVWRSIALRRGQPAFRDALIRAYDGRCALTGWEVLEALEAAHIVPFAEGGRAVPTNGLLLRADLHTLFDLHLITVEPEDRTVRVHPRLRGMQLGELEGQQIREPKRVSEQPARGALADHFRRSMIAWKVSD